MRCTIVSFASFFLATLAAAAGFWAAAGGAGFASAAEPGSPTIPAWCSCICPPGPGPRSMAQATVQNATWSFRP